MKQQAGTLAKAILEAVMNAVDAKAKKCTIELTQTWATIVDDGIGMKSRAEILEHFERFGTPQTPEESKVYGKFRMGRGQLFAFGFNKWRTGNWEMTVDINTHKLEYDLVKLPEKYQGCLIHVGLYTHLSPSSLDETERMLAQWTKYAPIEVVINDKRVSCDVADQKWDHVTDEAYIRLKSTGALSVYNLGIHTMTMDSHRFGTGGEIVSRKQLGVNFARNDVHDSCPVWQKIKPFVTRQADKKIAGKKQLTESERSRLADKLRLDDLHQNDVWKMKLFTLVNGRHVNMQGLDDYWRQRKITVCDLGNYVGDRIYQSKLAVVLAEVTLERFKVATIQELLAMLREKYPHASGWLNIKVVPFEDLSAKIESNFRILLGSELTPLERLWLKVAEAGKSDLIRADELDEQGQRNWKASPAKRSLHIGDGPADGWTDGSSYVAIDRKFLKRIDLTINGFGKLGNLLLHEYCHDGSSAESHLHDHEFYEMFHNSADSLGSFIDRCLGYVPSLIRDSDRQMTKRQLKDQDRKHVAGKAAATSKAVVESLLTAAAVIGR